MSQRDTSDPDEGKARRSRITRRSLLAGAAGAAGAAILKNSTATADEPPTPSPQQASPDPTKAYGRPATPVGARSTFERPERSVTNSPGGVSRTPLQDLNGMITPSDLHFERHHAGVPRIDPADYSLLIHSMVERPMKFSLGDLKRFPSRTQI